VNIDVDIDDLVTRAAHAFWQGAAPVLVGAQFTSWGEAKSVAVAAACAGGSAVLSMLKGTLKGWLAGRRAARPKHAAAPVRASAQDLREAA
jgi:hypothetical protein